MVNLSLALVLLVPSAAAAPPSAGSVRVVETTAGAAVTLTPGSGVEHAKWVELSGPSVLLGRGESERVEMTLRPRVAGTYRLASLPSVDAPLHDAALYELRVVLPEGWPEDSPERPAAAVEGDLLAGAGENVYLRATILSPEAERQDEPLKTRWRQLSGPRLGLGRAELRRPVLGPRPELPGRYRFAVRLGTKAGRTPWATFTFEVPSRPDGGAARRPVARLTRRGGGRLAEEVVLDGSESLDPDGGKLRYEWERLSGPEVKLVGGGARVSVFPVLAGRYSFALTVVDEMGLASERAEIVFEVAPPSAPPEVRRPEAAGPLDRPFSILLKDAPLSVLFSRLSDAGVTVRTSPELGSPLELGRRRLDLWTVDLPARRVLDWLGRMLDASYVIEEPGAVWFCRSTKWLEREPVVAETHRIDALYAAEDAADLLAILRESLRSVLWAGSEASIGGADTDAGTITAILPRSAQSRVRAVLKELRRGVPSGAPPVGGDPAPADVTARRVVADYADWELRDLLWDLARQARVTIAYDSLGEVGVGAAAAAGQTRLSLELGEVALGEALSLVVERTAFSGYSLEPPGAVWLARASTPALSSECLWQSAEVRSYDTRLLERGGGYSGPMLVHLVKSRVLPGRWKGPYVLAAHSEARSRLVVIHDREAQLAVAEFLKGLASPWE